MTSKPITLHPDLPRIAVTWPEWMRDIYVERIAIMREANRIPDDNPTPQAIHLVAMEQIEERKKDFA